MQAHARRSVTLGNRTAGQGDLAVAAEEEHAGTALPGGTITFLFTDVEGSSRAWLRNADTMGIALARHDAVIERLVAEHHGRVVRPRGEGDSRFAVFGRASDGLAAAAAIQLALAVEEWPLTEPLRVRISLHTGEADLRLGDYYGPAVNHCARLRAAAHGGQVVVSAITADLVREALPTHVSLLDLGLHHLKDLDQPERVWQLLHPNLRAEFPPLASLSTRRHNLPNQLSSFVGRDQAIVELSSLLASTRLLTLTGPGGVGKTRLALRVAAEALTNYADGVWLARLEALADPELVPAAIASALGVRQQAGCMSLLECVVEAVGSQQLLLVLDNCEHLIQSCAEVVEYFLHACPAVRVLATSRQPLGSAAEVAWRVGALSIAAAIEAASTDQIATSDAVQLFVERAQAVRPEFRLTEQNASAIVRICRRLDALPLAIELAAARVNVLDVLQIEERVDDRFHLLATGLRTAAARQRTLHATLDWSYDLLPESERRVFERLSVFASGCSLNAAEAVCATNGVAPAEVLDRLGQLVDKSLVSAEPQSDETLWFRLLETPRQYGRERLAERGELESTLRRQVDWYVQLASKANNGMRFGDGQAAWLARLDREHDNLRSVLTWTIAHGEADVALHLGAGLWRFWHYRGHLDEGRAWLARILALQGTLYPARLVVLLGAGIMAQAQGDAVAARAYHEEQLALATGPETWTWRAAALTQLGHLTFGAGDLRRARSLYRRGLAIWEQHEDRWGAANCLDGLARIALRERHYPQARQLVQRALAAYQTTHDEIQEAGCQCLLGQADLEEGKLEPARARFRMGLTILKGLGVSVGTVTALVGSARLALAEGRYERAVHLLGAVSTQRVRLGVATDWDAREEAGPACQALGDATTQAAMAAGGTLSLVQAVAYALEEYDPWPAMPTTSSSVS